VTQGAKTTAGSLELSAVFLFARIPFPSSFFSFLFHTGPLKAVPSAVILARMSGQSTAAVVK